MQAESVNKLGGYTDRNGVIHIDSFKRAIPPSTWDHLKSIAKNLALLLATVLFVIPFAALAWLFCVGLPRLQKFVK